MLTLVLITVLKRVIIVLLHKFWGREIPVPPSLVVVRTFIKVLFSRLGTLLFFLFVFSIPCLYFDISVSDLY